MKVESDCLLVSSANKTWIIFFELDFVVSLNFTIRTDPEKNGDSKYSSLETV